MSRQELDLQITTGTGTYSGGFSLDVKMVNWAIAPTPDGRTGTMLTSIPGSKTEVTVAPTVGTGCRGLFTASTGPASTGYAESLYAVYGDSLFRVGRNGSSVLVGAGLFDAGTDISFAQNQDQTETNTYGFVCDGRTIWRWNLKMEDGPLAGSLESAGTLPFVNGTTSTTAITSYITYCQYRLILTCSNSTQWFYTAQNASNFTSIGFASSESNADRTIRVIQHAGALWAFSMYSYDIFNPTNVNSNPFASPAGNSGKIGLASGDSVATVGDYLVWLGQGPTSDSAVFLAGPNGAVSRVSTPGIETILQKWLYKSRSKAMAWSERGLTFYALTSVGDQMTLVYCLETKTWHTRSSSNTGIENCWSINGVASAYGKVWLGTDANDIVSQDSTTCVDYNSKPITRVYQTPVIVQQCDYFKLLECKIDIDTGVGTQWQDIAGVMIETQAQVWLQISWDGGRTFGDRKLRNLGIKGQYGNQIAWNGCGGGRNLVIRIGTSAPYPLSLYRIKLSVEKAGRT